MAATAAEQALIKQERGRLLALVEERYGNKMGLKELHEENRRDEVYRLKDARDMLKKPQANEILVRASIALAKLILNNRYQEFDHLHDLYQLAANLLSAQAPRQLVGRKEAASPAA